MRLRPLSVPSQEEFINQEFGEICIINTSLYFLLSGLWHEQKFVAVFPDSHGLPPSPHPHCVLFPVSKQKHPFNGVGGLRKDQIEEKDDEKAKTKISAENCLLVVRK